MKELIVGDIGIYTEDDERWDELIKVLKKVNEAYKETKKPKKDSWIGKLKKIWKRKENI